MQRGIDRADARSNDPRAGRTAPGEPAEVAIAGPRLVAQQRRQRRQQHRRKREEADRAALGEGVYIQAVSVRVWKVLRLVVVLAGFAAPLAQVLVADLAEIVLADAEPGILLPGHEPRTPDAVAERQHVIRG